MYMLSLNHPSAYTDHNLNKFHQYQDIITHCRSQLYMLFQYHLCECIRHKAYKSHHSLGTVWIHTPQTRIPFRYHRNIQGTRDTHLWHASTLVSSIVLQRIRTHHWLVLCMGHNFHTFRSAWDTGYLNNIPNDKSFLSHPGRSSHHIPHNIQLYPDIVSLNKYLECIISDLLVISVNKGYSPNISLWLLAFKNRGKCQLSNLTDLVQCNCSLDISSKLHRYHESVLKDIHLNSMRLGHLDLFGSNHHI